MQQHKLAVLQPQDTSATVPDQCKQQHNIECQQKLVGTGPWSLDWLSQIPISEGGNTFSSPCLNEIDANSSLNAELISTLPSKKIIKKKKGGAVKLSVGFMKRVARMSDMDRREILKILKKQNMKRKVRKVTNNTKAATNSTSDSSKNSSSLVNKDWENWVLLHGKAEVVAYDVRDIGKEVGVKYKCDTNNNFNLLTREGRMEWRAAGGSEVVRGVVCGSGDGVKGC